jgi:hypothetical protein
MVYSTWQRERENNSSVQYFPTIFLNNSVYL